MFFGGERKKIEVGDKRVILVIGGSGLLGKAFAEAQPAGTFIVNISRKSELSGEDIYNHHFDLRKDPEVLMQDLARILPRVDVLIHMAYTRTFRSIEQFSREQFADEMNIDVAVPILLSRMCGDYFWKQSTKEENSTRARKVISISSGASFGKTARPELATYSAAKSALNVISQYLHDFLFGMYAVSAHVVAPGALYTGHEEALARTVSFLWALQEESKDSFSLEKVQ